MGGQDSKLSDGTITVQVKKDKEAPKKTSKCQKVSKQLESDAVAATSTAAAKHDIKSHKAAASASMAASIAAKAVGDTATADALKESAEAHQASVEALNADKKLKDAEKDANDKEDMVMAELTKGAEAEDKAVQDPAHKDEHLAVANTQLIRASQTQKIANEAHEKVKTLKKDVQEKHLTAAKKHLKAAKKIATLVGADHKLVEDHKKVAEKHKDAAEGNKVEHEQLTSKDANESSQHLTVEEDQTALSKFQSLKTLKAAKREKVEAFVDNQLPKAAFVAVALKDAAGKGQMF